MDSSVQMDVRVRNFMIAWALVALACFALVAIGIYNTKPAHPAAGVHTPAAFSFGYIIEE